jgi:hypothetical protein
MSNVTSDPSRNRLYITLAGHMSPTERQEIIRAIMAEVAKLTQGFDIVTDITTLHASDQEGFKDLMRARSALKLKGAGHVIRVVKIPLSRIQMERISEAAGYQDESVDSLEEADRRLDELKAGAMAEV